MSMMVLSFTYESIACVRGYHRSSIIIQSVKITTAHHTRSLPIYPNPQRSESLNALLLPCRSFPERTFQSLLVQTLHHRCVADLDLWPETHDWAHLVDAR